MTTNGSVDISDDLNPFAPIPGTPSSPLWLQEEEDDDDEDWDDEDDDWDDDEDWEDEDDDEDDEAPPLAVAGQGSERAGSSTSFSFASLSTRSRL